MYMYMAPAGFVCLFVWFTDGPRWSVVDFALLREEPVLPEVLGLKGRQMQPLSCARY